MIDVAVLDPSMVLRLLGMHVRAAFVVGYICLIHLHLARADTWCLPILVAAAAAVALTVASLAATEWHFFFYTCAVIQLFHDS